MFKKILSIWIIFVGFIAITSWDYKVIVTTILSDIQTTNANKTDSEKKQTFQSYIIKIQSLNTIDQRVKDALITYLNSKIAELENTWSQTTTYTSNITNIDKELVEKTWLDLHNTERQEIGQPAYTINTDLNNTAQNRASYLAKIWYSTHKRTSTDWYYSYDSIKGRFWDLWITFPKEQNWVASFSENIAYQYLSCNKTDCTAEVIASLKKCFAFFMSEKYKSYKPHYKAVSSSYFKNMWYWIAKVGTKIFVVTHYSVDF